MPLKVRNSLTRRKEILTSPTSQQLKMFVCGPTVYDYVHLGHARTYLAFDTITRYLKFSGYKVHYLMNITDVAERVVQRAEQLKRDPIELAREYEAAFLDDMRALGVTEIDKFERASEAIPKMIDQVTGLIDKGAAYETETGVYFEVQKYPKFGQLSGLSHEELSLRRLELCSSKKNPEDFSLWRKYEKGLAWDSPWGRGRPGWHIEDTAISMATFGETYDIHGGASELIFPHHEAEISQAESLTGKAPFVRYWLHTGLLNVGGRKMSKSLGNMIRIRDALKEYTAAELRFYFATVHYREPMTYSHTGLKDARRRLNRLQKNLATFAQAQPQPNPEGERTPATLAKHESTFKRFMNDDFYTPGALTVLEEFANQLGRMGRKVNQHSKMKLEDGFRKMANVLGILS
ncbi:MAG TPA: cysteine--tRNA ligase [archaeon]|nr:cysteine--tRNA ligase [archaeon]